MKASVIVAVYNNEEMIGDCIESLLRQRLSKKEFDGIIVDNNSTDRTREIIQKHKVKYLFEERMGRARALNKGIRNAKGEIIAVTDSDCIAHKDWLENIVKKFGKKSVVYAGGEILAYKPRTLVEKYSEKAGILSARTVLKKNIFYPPFFQTANASFRKSLLDEIGLFDEALVSGHDADIGWRIQWKGHGIDFEPSAVIYHRNRTTMKGLFEQFKRYGLSRTALFKKHRKMLKAFFHIDFVNIGGIFYALLQIIPSLILGRTELERKKPILDFVKRSAFLYGKILGSIKNKVIEL